MVGRHDRRRLDAVLAGGLGGRHRLEIAVGPVRGEAKLERRLPRPGRVGRQGAGHQHILIVQPGGDAVHGPNEGIAPAADHPQADAPFDHGAFPSSPSTRRFAAWSTPLPAKSSNARSVTRMMWSRMKAEPSRAPSSGCFKQHSHSSTAQPAYPYWASFEKMPRKSTWPSPTDRQRPARLSHD